MGKLSLVENDIVTHDKLLDIKSNSHAMWQININRLRGTCKH